MRMRGQLLGSMIAAVFGLVYVGVNTGSLPSAVAVALRIAAVLAFVAVLAAVYRAGRTPDVGPSDPGRVFGTAYWLVVAAEVVALLVGVRVLTGPLDVAYAGVAWVSFVVGVHFFALAVVFGESFFHRLGAAITGCGVVGLVLAVAGAGEQRVDVVAGVVPGALLLVSGWWGARTAPRRAAPATADVS
jgi:hypothetical protein